LLICDISRNEAREEMKTIIRMNAVMITFIAFLFVSCAPQKGGSDADAQRALTLSGIELTFCSESALNTCIESKGGAACGKKHCNKENYEDNVCALKQFSDCLDNDGGTGCKKYCGHPVQCLRKSSVFDCGPGGCQCFDTGMAANSPLGDTIIDLATTGGLSFAGFLIKKAVVGVTKISATAIGSGAARALAGNLDASFGQAFNMGARFGLRMTAHSHELTAQGTIRAAPSILKVRIDSAKQAVLPQLGANAENYIWIVDDAGNFIIAPEVKLAVNQTLGHPTLCGGCAGRIAGEVEKVTNPNGTIKYIINNQSGRYFNDVNHGQSHLENAAKVLQLLVGQNVEVVAQFLNF
jgi:hypothetical protein